MCVTEFTGRDDDRSVREVHEREDKHDQVSSSRLSFPHPNLMQNSKDINGWRSTARTFEEDKDSASRSRPALKTPPRLATTRYRRVTCEVTKYSKIEGGSKLPPEDQREDPSYPRRLPSTGCAKDRRGTQGTKGASHFQALFARLRYREDSRQRHQFSFRQLSVIRRSGSH